MAGKRSKEAENLASQLDEGSLIPKDLTRHEQLLLGYITVQDLDKDELRLKKCRNPDGTFVRGRPRPFPEHINASIGRELHRRIFDEINKHGFDAVDTIVEVMHRGEGASSHQGQKDGTKRLDAAKYLLERVVGTIPTKTENTTEVTVWQGLNENGGLFVDVDAEDIKDDSPRELEVRTEPEAVRKRGPRTRPRRPPVDGS